MKKRKTKRQKQLNYQKLGSLKIEDNAKKKDKDGQPGEVDNDPNSLSK